MHEEKIGVHKMLWRGWGLLKNCVVGTTTAEETENRSDSTDGDQATNWATKKLNPQTWHQILDKLICQISL
jgi:hypothetical protein